MGPAVPERQQRDHVQQHTAGAVREHGGTYVRQFVARRQAYIAGVLCEAGGKGRRPGGGARRVRQVVFDPVRQAGNPDGGHDPGKPERGHVRELEFGPDARQPAENDRRVAGAEIRRGNGIRENAEHENRRGNRTPTVAPDQGQDGRSKSEI